MLLLFPPESTTTSTVAVQTNALDIGLLHPRPQGEGVIIPITETVAPHFSLQVDLDGTTYSLVFDWHPRSATWRVSLMDDEELIEKRSGEPVRLDWPMFINDLPGYIVAECPTPLAGTFADLANLTLYYVSGDELAAQVA